MRLVTSDPRSIAAAYDHASTQYDDWQWQEFWRRNEQPLVRGFLEQDGVVDITLDIGVGTGAYANLLGEYSHEVVGIDIGSGMLGVSLVNHPTMTHIYAAALELPFRDDSFQRIMAARVLSHISSLHYFFRQVSRTLRPGGSLIITDVDPEHDYEAINLPGKDVNEKPIRLIPNKHSIEQLTRFAACNGLILKTYSPVRYSDLIWKPRLGQLPSLDRSGRRRIFYVIKFHTRY